MVDTILGIINDVRALNLAASDELIVANLLLSMADQAVFAKQMLATY